jgi:hypothetical protein
MNLSKPKIFSIILVFALILGGTYLIWKLNSENEHQPESTSIYEYQEVSQPEAADIYEYRDEPASPDTSQDGQSEESEYQVYNNSRYNFSFKYPKGFTVANFQEGEYGETILVRKEQISFQIFIGPFDEPDPLTKERILKDVPDMVIDDAQQRILKNGVPGLIFFSQESSLGRTREVWFVHNGFLYQVSTLAELDKRLAEILGTWKFH